MTTVTHPIARAITAAFTDLDDTDFGLGTTSDPEAAFRDAAESLDYRVSESERHEQATGYFLRDSIEVQVSAPWICGLADLPSFPRKAGFTVLWDDSDNPATPESDEPATEAEVSCLISEDGTPGRWTLKVHFGDMGEAADQITEWLASLTDEEHAHAAHRIIADWIEREVDEDEIDALPAWVRAHAN